MSTPNPLSLIVVPSRWMIVYLSLLHGLALVSLTVLPLFWSLMALIATGLFLHYGYFLWKRTGIYSDQRIARLIYTADQKWQLLIKEQVLNARLQQATIWPWLIVLNFIDENTRQPHSLVLFPDSADGGKLRQLRVVLRHQAF